MNFKNKKTLLGVNIKNKKLGPLGFIDYRNSLLNNH